MACRIYLLSLLWAGVLFYHFESIEAVGGQMPQLIFGQEYLGAPAGIGIDATTRMLFVADNSYNRVVRYDSIDTLTTSSVPNAVFGQPNLSGTSPNQGGTPSASTMSSPRGLWVDAGGTLWVADAGNSRVLYWRNAATKASASPADGVVGQPDFVSTSPTTTPFGMNYPNGLSVNDTTLWVADQANNRVLRFDGASLPSFPKFNASANAVFGPSDFYSAPVGCSSTLLSDAGHVLATPDLGLFIGDVGNNRVVYYTPSEAAKTIGGTASFVYGQVNLTDTTYGYTTVTPSTIASPGAFALDSNNNLFHVSYGEARVLQYPPVPPTQNFIAAADVFGQQDLYSDVAGSAPDQLNLPWMIQYDATTQTIWVTDSGNSRVVVYSVGVPVVDVPTAAVQVTFQGKTPNVVMAPKDSTGNTQSGQQFVLQPYSIEEIDSNQQIVSTLPLPLSGWTITSSIDEDNNQFFTFSLASPSVEIKYSLFAVPQNLNSAGVSFQAEPNALKFEVTLDSWGFASSTNTLRLHLYLTLAPMVTGISRSSASSTTTFKLNSGGVMETVINLLEVGEADNSAAPIGFALDPLTSANSNLSLLDLVLELPHFMSTFTYDPDFSVTLTGKTEDSSSDPDYLPLLALIALIIVPIVFIVVGAVVTVWIVLKKRKAKRAIMKGGEL